MFTNNPLLRKHVQISEEALPAVRIPLLFDNNLYVLTQHDVRRIEDTRLFSISKIMPNGDLQTINAEDVPGWMQQYSKPENLLSNQILSNLLEFLSSKKNSHMEVHMPQQHYSVANDMVYPQPMDISTTACNRTAADSIEQQRQWNTMENTSPLFPMHYSCATSTTEIDYKQQDPSDCYNMATCGCPKICRECGRQIRQCNKSTNTVANGGPHEVLDAREQLKRNKLRYCFP